MRSGTRDAVALAVGASASGVLAYAFFALSTRTLGPVASAPVSVLWTYWSFATAALTFPVQHWITRSVAALGGEQAVRRGLPRVMLAGLGLAVLAVVLAWIGHQPLFHRDDVWFPVLAGLVTLGSAWSGVVRGGLSARTRFLSVGAALAGENALRCLGAVALVVAGVQASVGYGLCLAAGPLVGFAWPSSFRFQRGGDTPVGGSPWSFLAGAASGQVVGQAILTGSPVVLALSGGRPADVTALFVGLALFRAPYTLAVGLVSALTGRVTTWVVQGRHRALQRLTTGIGIATVATAVGALLLGAQFGPPVIRLVFGSEIDLSPLRSGIIACGSALALGNLVMTVVLLAHARSSALAPVWLLGLALGALSFALSDASPTTRTTMAFLVAETGAFAALVVDCARRARLVRRAA